MVFFNKKGIVFTIVALIISAFVLVMFFYLVELPVDHGVDVTTIKVKSVNNFLGQVEELVSAQAVSSSHIAINEFIETMYNTQSFFPDFDNSFEVCLSQGTGCDPDANFKEKVEVDLSNFVRDNLGLNIDLAIDNIQLVQHDPWHLNISFEMISFIEMAGFSWNVSSELSRSFSILGFRDPVEASSSLTQRPDLDNITRINHNINYKNVSGDWLEKPSRLNYMSIDKNYFEYSKGVSFLNRLRGNLTSDEFGIVRVQLPLYDSFGDVIRSGRSNLDWHFWRNTGFADPDQLGIFDFNRLEDRLLVLGLSFPATDLNNTLHEAILPRDLAEKANVANNSYFSNHP